MQTKKKTLAFGRRPLLTGILCYFLSACSGGGGNGGGIPDPTPEVSTGEVTFTPDWGSIPASSALRFHFYPSSGAVVTKDGNSTGFKGALEKGTYKVLAYNTDATGVVFENTDSYDKASVRVSAVAASRSSSTIGQPGNVYTLTMENLTVEKAGTVSPKSAVRSLVRELSLRFVIDGGSAVSSIQGLLNGFYPSVLLATGKPDASAQSSANDCGVSFEVPAGNNTSNVALRSLGMSDPKSGTVYRSLLLLDVTDKSGATTRIQTDLSEALTDILAKNDGVLPGDTAAEVTIALKVSFGQGLTATVTDWIPGNNDVSVDL